jgi:hypothetical protein
MGQSEFVALYVLRVLGPALLVATAATFIFARAAIRLPPSGPITPVVVRVITPRVPLILVLLSLAALTYAADAILAVVLAVVYHKWPGASEQWRGLEIGDFLGLLAFASASILGTWKHSHGTDIWLTKRAKLFAIFACIFDVVLVFLTARSIDFSTSGALACDVMPAPSY